MNIIIDAMGGDNAPKSVVEACVMAAEKYPQITITMVGILDLLKKELLKTGKGSIPNIKMVEANTVISNEEDAISAVKAKSDSSVVVGLKLLREGKGEAFISAGSTGALITAATLYVKRIKGVKRAALAPVLPSDSGCFVLVDAGANSDCKPEYLAQFGTMGSIYMNKIYGVEKPRVGLVNIGTEKGKGTDMVNAAYALLEKQPIYFTGNTEAREIPFGGADVVVCDGFVGNVILKFYEGVGSVFNLNLKDIFFANLKTKLGALLAKKQILGFKKKFDYNEYGGALLLGIDGLVIKAHGSSDKKALFNTIEQAKKAVDSNMLGEIRDTILKEGEKN